MMRSDNKGRTEKHAKNDVRVAIYVRESRDDYGENIETIETQRDMLIDYVLSNELGVVKGVYCDNNVSGTAFNRDGLTSLKSDVGSKLVDMVLVKDLSRLGRNNTRTLELLDYFEEHGIRVITYDGKFDSLLDNDTLGIETWYNERYVRDISRKTRASLRFKIKNGEYIGTAPYGYKKSLEKKNSLVVDEDKADVVRQIYTQYIKGRGYAAIARWLNELECAPPGHVTGETIGKWYPVTIKRILENRVYTGDTVQGVSEKISFKSKRIRRLPKNEWVITENTHPAIISKETYETVRRIILSRRSKENSVNFKHTYSGIIFCGSCGMPMYARMRKGRPTGYICSMYAKNGSDACESHFIRESDINEAVKSDTLKLFDNIRLCTEAEKLLRNYYDIDKKHDKNFSESWAKLNKKFKQQEELYMDKLEGRISFELFDRVNNNIEDEIKILQGLIKQYRYDSIYSNNMIDMISNAKNYIEEEGLNKSITQLLIDKIVVFSKTDLSNNNLSNSIEKSRNMKISNAGIVAEIYYKYLDL